MKIKDEIKKEKEITNQRYEHMCYEATKRVQNNQELELDKCNEILGARLNTIHNLRYYQRVMQGLRDAIEADSLDEFVHTFYEQKNMPVPAL